MYNNQFTPFYVKGSCFRMIDTFIFTFKKTKKYDIESKAYFDSPMKQYATDVGLRNAKHGFRQFCIQQWKEVVHDRKESG